MINRVLIRIKVIQILYSYLLTQSDFHIESAPESESRDKRYAYSLYLDLLLLILRISGFRLAGSEKLVGAISDNKYLSAGKMVRSLFSDVNVRSVIFRRAANSEAFNDAALAIYSKITQSGAYRSYIRTKDLSMKDDVAFWVVIIRTIMEKSPELTEAARKNPDYTIAGYEHAFKMLVSTLEGFSDTRTMFIEARNSLERSLDKARELYFALLLLPIELTRLQARRLDNARHKYLPSPEDLNPDTRFIDNTFVANLEESPEMKEYLKSNPISWDNGSETLKLLLDKVLQSDIYADYMAAPGVSYADDCEFWRSIIKNVILPSDILAEAIESESVYWNDDLDIIGTFVIKTIKRASADPASPITLLPKFKDDEDARFGGELFVDTVENYGTYRSYIDKFINEKQWDPERLAFMDVIIMCTAISELLNFPSIPVPVTMNEYIEIANCYSTSKSGQFINGILFSVINYLKKEGKLLKN